MLPIPQPVSDYFRNKHVLITGGVGFIGSNLARYLVAMGAQVLLVDSLIPKYGGNLFNIADIRDQVRLNIADVRDEHGLRFLVKKQDVIFNLAGQVSHTDSMVDPYADLEINARSQQWMSTGSINRPANGITSSTTTFTASRRSLCA
jgi:UDP-glucose 4-epimerase